MGKGKKKFNSKEAEHFYLLHRSQTDAAHQQEQRPSNFVLVKAADAPQNKSRTLLSNRFSAPPVLDKKEALRLQGGGVVDAESYFSDKVASASAGAGVGAKGNHVTALGFKNDGYDYSQHLKVMGGGMFVGADGKRQQLQSQVEVDLPQDALPSSEEFDRQLEAVTLDHTCMDDDLQGALFDDDVVFGEGEDCDFEEICDDFIATAMSEPEVPDFDYDKHIAELIARSQKNMQQGSQGPRGWEKELEGGSQRPGGARTMYDDDSDEVESFNGEDDEEALRRMQNGGHEGEQSAYQRMVEDQFDRVVDEYEDDENLGDLEDAALEGQDELCGTIELEDLDNEILNDALNEFMQESKDDILCNGLGESSYKKGSRHIDQIEKWEPSAEQPQPEEVALQIQNLNLELEPEEEDLPEEEFILQDYLRANRVEEEWDCETILSTYSTLDNHPAVISTATAGPGGTSSRRKKKKAYRGKNKREEGDEDASEYDGGSCYGGSTVASSYQVSAYQSQYSSISQSALPGARYFSKGQMKSVDAERNSHSKKIVLVGQHLLPLGFGAASNSNSKDRTGDNGARSKSSKRVPLVDVNSRHKKLVVPIAEGEDEDNDDDDEEDDVEEEVDDEDEVDGEDKKKVKVVKRKETAEEKRIRKSLVKEQRRAKRSAKKENKLAYRREETRQGTITDQHQDTDRISVFKY